MIGTRVLDSDPANYVTVSSEELDVLVEGGLIELDLHRAGEARCRLPFTLDDVLDSLKEMRNPDVV